MTSFRHCLIASVLVLALGACGKEDATEPGAGAAGGEVLEGTISDAMLPLDKVRSQPPLAPKPDASAGAKADQDSSETDETGTKDPEPAQAPAAAGSGLTPDAE